MTFNIGSQQAGQINNTGGDQTIYGGQHATISSPADALVALQVLRAAVDVAELPRAKKRSAKQHVEEIAEELRRPEPDKRGIAGRLADVTKILLAAGAFVSGGTSLAQAVSSLATWLGALGAGVVALLPAGRMNSPKG